MWVQNRNIAMWCGNKGERFMTQEQIEEKVYNKMCRGCPYEKECHDKCENCDDYLDEVAWAMVLEEKKKVVEKKI